MQLLSIHWPIKEVCLTEVQSEWYTPLLSFYSVLSLFKSCPHPSVFNDLITLSKVSKPPLNSKHFWLSGAVSPVYVLPIHFSISMNHAGFFPIIISWTLGTGTCHAILTTPGLNKDYSPSISLFHWCIWKVCCHQEVCSVSQKLNQEKKKKKVFSTIDLLGYVSKTICQYCS